MTLPQRSASGSMMTEMLLDREASYRLAAIRFRIPRGISPKRRCGDCHLVRVERVVFARHSNAADRSGFLPVAGYREDLRRRQFPKPVWPSRGRFQLPDDALSVATLSDASVDKFPALLAAELFSQRQQGHDPACRSAQPRGCRSARVRY